MTAKRAKRGRPPGTSERRDLLIAELVVAEGAFAMIAECAPAPGFNLTAEQQVEWVKGFARSCQTRVRRTIEQAMQESKP
jgi:hypothetical protein